MCGIVGAVTFETLSPAEEKIRQEAIIYLTTELMSLTQVRGKDATGVSTLFNDGEYIGLKNGKDSSDFLSSYGDTDEHFDNYLAQWRKRIAANKVMKVYIGHCRKSSVGNTWDNVNNHPIKVGDIVGIHNGTLTNHNEIFEKLQCPRDGEVDSEAIMRLLYHFTTDGTEPFTTDILSKVVNRLYGSHAVLAFNANNPYQVSAFRDGRPIEMALVRPLKTLFFASELPFLKKTMLNFNTATMLYKLFPPDMYLTKENVEFCTFTDDTAAIFDLTADITDTTNISNIVQSVKVPQKGKKDTWKNNTKKEEPYSYYHGYTSWDKRNNKNNNTGNKTWHKDNPKSTVIGAPSKWDADTRQFVTNTATKDSKKETHSKSLVTLAGKPYAFTDTNNLEAITDTAVIEEHSKDKTPPNIEVPTIDEVAIEVPTIDESIDATTIEVDCHVDADALETANIFSDSLQTYISLEDMIEDLMVEDVDAIQKLTKVALANRLKRLNIKYGFYKGFIKGKEAADHEVTTQMVKQERREEHIRTFKTITTILANVLDKEPGTRTLIDRYIRMEKFTTPLNDDKIKALFSKTDLSEIKSLGVLLDE